MPVGAPEKFEGQIADLRTERLVRKTVPQVIVMKGKATELQPPGSVCITVGLRGSDVVRKLAKAATEHDANTIDQILTPMKEDIFKRKQADLTTLARMIEQTDSFVDVMYEGKPLIQTVFVVHDIPISRAILPYVGGSLDAKKFIAVEYQKSPTGQGTGSLDVLVTVHEPEIDPAVAAVLKQLPKEFDSMRLGISPGTVACTATATPVVVAVMVATVATAVTHCAPDWNHTDWVINPSPELAGLAPELSVAKLIARREQLLGRSVR